MSPNKETIEELKAKLKEAEEAQQKEAEEAQQAQQNAQANDEEAVDVIFGTLMSKVETVAARVGVGSKNREVLEGYIYDAHRQVNELFFDATDENEDDLSTTKPANVATPKPSQKNKGKARVSAARVAPAAGEEIEDDDEVEDEQPSTADRLQVMYPVNSPMAEARKRAAQSTPSKTATVAKKRKTATTSRRTRAANKEAKDEEV